MIYGKKRRKRMGIKELNETLASFTEPIKEEQNGGYYIYKMIYFEGEDVNAEVIDFIERKGYMGETDYGIVEFSKDRYDDMLAEFDNLPIEDKTKSDGKSALTIEEIKEGLGDISRLFDEGKIDIAIKVY
jgi:hypothetical protein